MNIEQKYITSLEVAEMVEKDHKNLLRDLKIYSQQLGELNIEHTDFFVESKYLSSQNKELPCFNITKKGCEFIAHKLTGVKGTSFTARYINRFHEMEDSLKIPTTTSGMIQLLAQGHTELEQKVNSLNEDLQNFKTEMPLLAIECQKITDAKNRKVISIIGGKESNAYKNSSLRGKVYSDLNRELMRQFGVTSYKAIRRNQTDEAIRIINEYALPYVLKEQIDFENAQITF